MLPLFCLILFSNILTTNAIHIKTITQIIFTIENQQPKHNSKKKKKHTKNPQKNKEKEMHKSSLTPNLI